MKCALALCLILFALGVMTKPFGNEADSEEKTRAERERERGKWDNFGEEKRADGVKEYKREGPEAEFKRADAVKEYKRSFQECTTDVGLWQDATIYYAICAAAIKTQKVMNALAKLQDVFSGLLEFVDVTTPDYSCGDIPNVDHYIAFQNTEAGCWSYIGKTSGSKQTLNLHTGSCESEGVIMHEMLHAVGLYHTQQRPDAAEYITVNSANIKPGKEGNFAPKSGMCTACRYQTCSIMHYRSKSFASSGKTIQAKNAALEPQMGNQKKVEASDMCSIYLLYHLYEKETCATNGGSLCKYGTGKEYDFKCCKCPPMLEGDLCDTFKKMNSNDKEYELSDNGTPVTVKSQTGTKYSPKTDEIYFFKTADNCKIQMTVKSFFVEADAECYWDQFYYWNDESILDCPGTICGQKAESTTFTSKSNFFMIKLVSDDMYQMSGFELEFKAVNCS